MSARASAVLALLLVAINCADAAPVAVPRSALPGRERQQLLDPFPPPRAGQGPFINMQAEPAPRSKPGKSKKKKR
jgi:hypothetical protein